MNLNTQKLITILFVTLFSTMLSAQVQNVKLVQTKGEFATTSLELAPGQYQFEIANQGVGHDVGFVLVPQGQYDATDHIKEAYVKAPVATGKSSMTNVVNLEAGTYEYFCPLNPTDKYMLKVADAPRQLKLTQTPGKFELESVTLAEGQYQFEIANEGVDHQVGFVLVPKGKYDQADHITAAYVKAPVDQGKSSMTNVIDLEAGMYEYFCPLNPTAKYPLVVTKDVKSVKFTQVPGEFMTKDLSLTAGQYQFEIANKGVGHDVGFVLVPQGQYEVNDHIKAAYVKAPVAEGKSSVTDVIDLKSGTYEYFCPLNPTEKYTLMVK